MVVGAYGASYARAEGGLAAPFLLHLSARHLLAATVFVVCLMIWSFGAAAALAALCVAGLFSRLTTIFCRRCFGGITGDTLGATNELVEVSFLLLLPLLVAWS